MTTDKVRVKIVTSFVRCELADIKYNNITLTSTCIYDDRDNWIDITLPEEIDGYKDWKVCIYYEDGSVKENNETIGWKAFMRHKDMAQGQEGYELQVTIY
jgi:hypothetical protein